MHALARCWQQRMPRLRSSEGILLRYKRLVRVKAGWLPRQTGRLPVRAVCTYLDEVAGRVEVRPGVRVHPQLRLVGDVAVGAARVHLPQAGALAAGRAPGNQVRAHADGQVYDPLQKTE